MAPGVGSDAASESHPASRTPPAESGPSPTRDLPGTIASIAGAITAAATLVVVPGSIALYLRLAERDLPADLGVVVSLPTEFLVAIGLTYVLFPLLVVVAAALLVLLVPGEERRSHPALRAWKVEDWAAFLATLAVVAVAPVLVAALSSLLAGAITAGVLAIWLGVSRLLVQDTGIRDEGDDEKTALSRPVRALLGLYLTATIARLGLAAAILAGILGFPVAVVSSPPAWAFALSFATVAVWLLLSWPIAHRFDPQQSTTALPAVGLTALVAIAVFVPWTVGFAVYRGEFPPATVCTSDGDSFNGFLIGEADDRVYVGESGLRIMVFVETGRLEDNILGQLRLSPEQYDIRLPGSPLQISYTRTDLLVMELERLFPPEIPADQLTPEAEEVLGSGRPVLGFSDDPDLRERARALGVDKVISTTELKSDLNTAVEKLFAAQGQGNEDDGNGGFAPPLEPADRIVSIPSSQVIRIVIGASGICPRGSEKRIVSGF